MFLLDNKKKFYDTLTGWFMAPIEYEVRVPTGDWSQYFGKYQNQRWGLWDSNSCWCLSAINSMEDQCEYLMKTNQFSAEATNFFKTNGYIDSDGDFSFSERYLEIKSGVHDNGNNQMEAWRLAQVYGIIPRSMLTYTSDRASSFKDKISFNLDYFNPSEVTTEMDVLGQKFLYYVNISRQWIGKIGTTPDLSVLRAALKQAPLNIGIPVPTPNILWNSTNIRYDGSRVGAQHAVELTSITDNGQYVIFDQYMPNIKVLSSDYLLFMVTQGIIQPQTIVAQVPVVQDTQSNSIWSAVFQYFNNIFSKTNPVGRLST